MFTHESRFFLGNGVVAAIAGGVYLGVSHDRVGAALFFTLAAAGVLVGTLLLGRYGAPTLETAGAVAPVADLPAPSAWPLVGALAATMLAVGLVVGLPLTVLGVGSIALAAAGWLVQAWREHLGLARATSLYAHDRVVWPAGLPMVAFVLIAVLVISFSRVLLAVSKNGAVAVAIAAAVAILLAAVLIAYRPRVSGGVLSGLLVLVGLAVVGAGIAAAAQGEREFHSLGLEPAEVTAQGTAFQEKEIELAAARTVRVEFTNLDEAPIVHNLAIYTDESAAEAIFVGEPFQGPGRQRLLFRAPDEPTEAFFRCDIHPEAMTGTVTFVEAAEEGHGE